MKKIGKYIVRGMLGKGGMGIVYKACLPYVNRIVALKLLAPHPNTSALLDSRLIREMFISEASTLASLRSPHFVQVLDFDFHGDAPFFTMEYYYHDLGRLIGETYHPELPTRILGLTKTISYTRQILTGLARLSRAGIVHRDIKPGNIMISDDDTIKICDFGLSKLRGERFDRPAQMMVGSPFYAAPEQERDPDTVDRRADLYSAAVILHRLLTGCLPVEGTLRPSEFHPDADASWDRFLDRALQQDPERRFASADEMIEELDLLDRAWNEKRNTFCRLVQGSPPSVNGQKTGSLRNTSVKVNARIALHTFACDQLMRPLHYSEEELPRYVNGTVIFDHAHDIAWQASGSEDPLDWRGAHEYVRQLNDTRFAGCARWRLPTIDELLSILGPPTLGIHDCIRGGFDKRQTMLWSSDRCTFMSAWYVDTSLGFAGFADFTCHFYVRAVSEGAGVSEMLSV
ncbi:MAG: protein kinase [Syntrophobacter sp.]